MSKEEKRSYKNIQDWEEKIINIFPTAIPSECVWLNEIDILNVLFTLCGNNAAKIFYPDGNKLGLYGADFSKEDRCLEIITENTIDVVKPYKLSFHYYDEAFEWSYFRLEIEDLKQICNSKNKLHKESLICLDNGEYIDIFNIDKHTNEECEDSLIIENATVVNRHLKKSSFLIFARSSHIEEFYDKSFNLYLGEELSHIVERLVLNENI